MTWLQLLADSPVSPIGTASGDVVTYILGFGPIGIIAIAFATGWLVPKGAVKEAREQARADLRAELDRTIAEKKTAEEQRDEALKVTRDSLIPALIQFTSATQNLLPLLQALISQRQMERHDREGRPQP